MFRWLGAYFNLEGTGTTLQREGIAGVTTFVTMA